MSRLFLMNLTLSRFRTLTTLNQILKTRQVTTTVALMTSLIVIKEITLEEMIQMIPTTMEMTQATIIAVETRAMMIVMETRVTMIVMETQELTAEEME